MVTRRIVCSSGGADVLAVLLRKNAGCVRFDPGKACLVAIGIVRLFNASGCWHPLLTINTPNQVTNPPGR